MVRGYHEYLHVSNDAIGEVLPCSDEDGNLHDPYAVAVRKVPNAGELSPAHTKYMYIGRLALNI